MSDFEACCDLAERDYVDQTFPLDAADSLDGEKMGAELQKSTEEFATDNEFEDENLEIECARGIAGDGFDGLTCGALDEEDDEPLIDAGKAKILDEDQTKIRQIRSFIKAVRTDPDWATQCAAIRIAMCPELQGELTDITAFMAENYNRRPKSVTVTTKFWTIDEVLRFVESSFAGNEVPAYQSALLVICKNPTNSLLELAKPLLAKIETIGVRAHLGKIYAEKNFKADRKRIRMMTKDFKSYMMFEAEARSLGLNIITSFQLIKDGARDKDFLIHWYDTVHSNNERYTVVNFGHYTHPTGMIFLPDQEYVSEEHSFEVEKDVELLPVSRALPPVGDLIQYILAYRTPT